MEEKTKKSYAGYIIIAVAIVLAAIIVPIAWQLGGKLADKESNIIANNTVNTNTNINSNTNTNTNTNTDTDNNITINDPITKTYKTKNGEYSVSLLASGRCLLYVYDNDYREGEAINCNLEKDGSYTTIYSDDGSQPGTIVVIENDNIISISGGNWYNEFNIPEIELGILYIKKTNAGYFVIASSAGVDTNASTSVYTKSGKELGEYYKNIISDKTGVYLYNLDDILKLEDDLINKDINYDADDTEYIKGLEKLTLTKYDVNGKELGKYKCVNNKCVAA